MNELQGGLKCKLRRLSASAPREARAAVEERLLTAFRTRKKRASRQRAMWAAAAACLLALGGSLLMLVKRGGDNSASGQGTVTADSFRGATAGFTALPYAQSDVPLEQAVIVRVSVRPSELGLMGVPMVATGSREKVRADLLIGQDGVTRAVRLVE